MANYRVTDTELSTIASAIRLKGGTSAPLVFPSGFVSAISAIETQGTYISKIITENGEYDPSSDNADAFSHVTVSVPTSAPPVLVSKSISQNGTYNPASDNADGYSNVTVNVSGGGGGIPGVLSGTDAPNDSSGSDGDFYIREYAVPSNIDFREYLESDGDAYINTGIYGGDTKGLYLKFKANGVNSPACARNTATNLTFGVTLPSVGTISLDFNTQRRQKSIDDGSDVEVYLSRRISEVNGDNIYSLMPLDTFTTPVPMILFGIYATNSYGLVPTSVRIYRATFTTNGEVIADFIPAIDGNGVPCMYEIISGTYFYNANNTGSFSSGGSINPMQSRIIYKKVKGSWHIMNQAST